MSCAARWPVAPAAPNGHSPYTSSTSFARAGRALTEPTIWIVDDSPQQVERARAVLAPLFTVEVLSEGEALLERVAGGEHPDVLLLDWQLPGISGLDVCRFIRQRFDEVALPILMLTVRDGPDDLTEALDAGANDYVAKPYDDRVLAARVRTLVRVRRQAQLLLTRDEDQRVVDAVRGRREAEQLARVAKERSEFEQQLIGIVSHDLRNPLAAILLGTAALLQRSSLDDRSKDGLTRIQGAAERAHRMVRDLLDFTRTRLGDGLPIQPASLDIHEMTRKAIDELRASSPDRSFHHESSGDGAGVWDQDRMNQVLDNLLSNALHYSPRGTAVTVRTRARADDVVLEVHNAGAPIGADVMPRLFRPMQRGVGGGDVSRRSVGLGLFIAKHIIDAHGGTIDVTSTSDDGTTFKVTLPLVTKVVALP